MRSYSSEYYKKNKERLSKTKREYYKKRKEEFSDKSRKCRRCGGVLRTNLSRIIEFCVVCHPPETWVYSRKCEYVKEKNGKIS